MGKTVLYNYWEYQLIELTQAKETNIRKRLSDLEQKFYLDLILVLPSDFLFPFPSSLYVTKELLLILLCRFYTIIDFYGSSI